MRKRLSLTLHWVLPTFFILGVSLVGSGQGSGDVNGDGVLDLLDALICSRIAAGYVSCEATPRCAECDVDGDGNIDRSDVDTISYYILHPFTLTVTKDGDGSGTVTSTPPGIDCGVDCTESYSTSTVVQLTPVPDPGSQIPVPVPPSFFAGWAGDADCDDGQVTMDADKTCIATFVFGCFGADTKVVMADGGLKRIADIQAGDMVMGYDFATFQHVACRVEQTVSYQAAGYLRINGIEVTQAHPFAVGPDREIKAGQLKVGDRVTQDDQLAEVTAVVRVDEPVIVYNLKIGGTRNFYVDNGEARFLVKAK